jgi:hypothetical protein
MCATFSRHLQRSGAMCVKCLWSEHAALMTFEENDAAASSGTGKVECFQVHAVAEHNALTHPRSWPCALDMTHTPSRLCRSTQCTARPSVRSSTGKLDTRVTAKRASVCSLALRKHERRRSRQHCLMKTILQMTRTKTGRAASSASIPNQSPSSLGAGAEAMLASRTWRAGPRLQPTDSRRRPT